MRSSTSRQPLHPAIPTSPNHPGFRHALLRRHGDAVRVDGTSGANDLLVMGTHTGTHVDALAHISHNGLLHGGASAADEQTGGRFLHHGVHTIEPDRDHRPPARRARGARGRTTRARARRHGRGADAGPRRTAT